MNLTTKTPIVDKAGSSNQIGFDWTITNPAIEVTKEIIQDKSMVYGFPRGGNPFIPSNNISKIDVGIVSLAYYGGVLAPNGKIICVPHSATSVLEIDVIANKTSTFGSLSATSNKWAGGVLAPDGKIYCAPRLKTTILEIDPVKRTTTEYPYVGGTYNGAVLGSDGKVYFMPFTTTSGDVMWFDPFTKQMDTFGNVGTALFQGGVLAPNGDIVCIPYSSDLFAVINTTSKTIKTYPTPASGGTNSKYSGGVLAPNGKIYCIPFNGQEILVIDPRFYTSYQFGSLSSSSSKYGGGFLAPDGYIYGVPCSHNDGTTGQGKILRIDWQNEIVSYVDIPFSLVGAGVSSKAMGGIVTPFGRAVCIPYNYDGILTLDFGGSINHNVCMSNHVNKL